MNLIQGLTNDPLQDQTIILPDGSSFFLEIYFMPNQLCWVINSLAYVTSTINFSLSGYRIVNSPNLLNQWSNVIPFGLACMSAGNRDPSLQEDFSSGNSHLYTLTENEVAEFTQYLQGFQLA
jgi:hypothetical protein